MPEATPVFVMVRSLPAAPAVEVEALTELTDATVSPPEISGNCDRSIL